MDACWQPGCIPAGLPGAWVVLQGPGGFLLDAQGPLFPDAWVGEQGLATVAEFGLGYYDTVPVYLRQLADQPDLPGCQWQSLRQHLLHGDAKYATLLGYAGQIATWAWEHRFCGACGKTLTPVDGERAMECHDCRLRHYPRLSPSMIVLVTRGDEILLARSPRFLPGVYSTLAGFVEPGETVEHCVIREIREEVCLEVCNVRYITSQSWPFPHSLMLGFHAEYASGEIVAQPDEIEDARWFRLDALPPLPAHRSISRYLIDLYIARRLGHAEPVLPG